ncbi:thioredoxin [Anaerocolumna aminovalerica]|jgi:thioredoxin 1|uniref:Thioredoxin n=1 Tax=Anaerocolumna aminovalerica TaxID=1527 RepID=A0A1I5HS59_9FIRM|nr:thioredoxin [Anaerocolumna aminovalerica]MBU5333005.1 thioredoxin [Anaerocolumna aminovalerica]MDU6264875.1 thioredoxin [Anaerocolumna aminovalerica]SFO51097.1 thioredoxin [Anaerocolumna aminovalerica]
MEFKFTDENFEAEVLKSNQLVLVDFYADWCGPCKMLAPTIEEVAKEYKDSVKVGKLNVDESPKTAEKYRVMTIPTLLFIKNGQVLDTVVGVIPKAQITERLEKLK